MPVRPVAAQYSRRMHPWSVVQTWDRRRINRLVVGRIDNKAHAVVGQVCERVPQGRQFPIEYRNDARLRGVENHIVQSEVAVYEGGRVVIRNVFR